MACWARSSRVLVTGVGGSSSPTYEPAWLSWNLCCTQTPLGAPVVAPRWSAAGHAVVPSLSHARGGHPVPAGCPLAADLPTG